MVEVELIYVLLKQIPMAMFNKDMFESYRYKTQPNQALKLTEIAHCKIHGWWWV
jgi:hypothetical protein